MGHFTITLPNNLQGDVRYGTIKKKSLFLDLFKTKKLNNEVKKGYIIKIEPTSTEPNEYRLLKTKEGKWTTDDDGGFQVTPDDEISASIKSAIDNYESQH
jgi:23S rRNA maturation-related 3'-5' exoribonuclease YhaM